MSKRLCIKSTMSNCSCVSSKLPASILLKSSTSLSSPNKCVLDISIFLKQSETFSSSPTCILAMAVIPIIAFIGVLISWLIRERKSDFASLACLADSYAFISDIFFLYSSSLSLVTSFMVHIAVTSPAISVRTIRIVCLSILIESSPHNFD